jgi:hypothetical protein
MEKSKIICNELKKLEKKKEELINKKKQEMIKEGKAFLCRKCSKTMIKNDASHAELETTLCHECLMIKRKKEYKEAILNKIKFGRIVDLELDQWGWFQNIKRITVYKQGMMYELKTVDDDDGDPYMIIDKEWKKEEPLEEYEDELKPWQKTRTERPLFVDDKKCVQEEKKNKGV